VRWIAVRREWKNKDGRGIRDLEKKEVVGRGMEKWEE